MTSVLDVENLAVTVEKNKKERVDILKGVSFSVEEGEVLGIVGESGSGKTMTARSIMRLLPERCTITDGHILFSGLDLVRVSESRMQHLRGKEISMIFQDPTSALNPVIPIGNQLLEMFLHHTRISKKNAKRNIIDILARIGIPDPEKRYMSFPHELSGGMNQRIMIAMMALITKPKLLIADEPTTGLDVTVEKRILSHLFSLMRTCGISGILITHNLGIVAEYCDRVVVMQEGEVVETEDVFRIFESPSHPYTRRLLREVPRI